VEILLTTPWSMPPNAAAHGFAMDQLMRWNLAVLAGIFVLAHLLLAIVIIRRRSAAVITRNGVLSTWKVEAAALLLLVLMYLAMAVTAQRLWAVNRFEGAAPGSMQVEVTGRQFQWYFRYPGADAEFGRTDPSLIAPAEGNPLGLVAPDEHGHDDIVASELVLPVNREVDLALRAQDVVHGFFIPAMRLKQNAVPGLLLHVHFTPVVLGNYPILCSQVCGLGHSRMQARLRVVSQPEFKSWLDAKTAAIAARAGR
jgi:cytochrome c oxidase subunit II